MISMKKKNNYFIERFIKQEDKVHKLTIEKQKELIKIYKDAKKNLEKDLAIFIKKYSLDNKFTNADLTKMLNTKELANFRYDIKGYIKEIERLGVDTEAGRKLKKELDIMAGRTRVSRKQELINSINTQLGLASQKSEKVISNHLKKVVHFAYDDTGKIVRGAGNTLAKLDNKLIERVISQNWKGSNYSARIWKNRNNLAKKVMKNISTGLIQGWDFKKMSIKLERDTGSGYFEARRLIHTETTGALENAKELAYKEMGVSKYKFIATIDDRTSSICLSLDGKIFDMKDRQIGVNCPFCHPFCRSVTVPVVDKKVKNKTRVIKTKKEIEKVNKSDIIKEEKKVVKKIDFKEADEELIRRYEDKTFKLFGYEPGDGILTKEEVESFKLYTSDEFENINRYLRGEIKDGVRYAEWERVYYNLSETSERIKNVLKNNYLDDDLILYRGISEKEFYNLKIGTEFNSFKSTTLDKGIMKEFSEEAKEKYSLEKEYKVIINAPKGTEGIYINSKSSYEDEREFLLNMGQKYKVIKEEENTLYLEVLKQ
ncbi:MAG: hypothetical protein CR959_00290 [Fusobacteriales bacterium]|nr:MAG: hypothetical protein CR959_00290 [Fusobacteriales bacterium]